jgi:hypothetical protein
MDIDHAAEPAVRAPTQTNDEAVAALIERWWADHFPGSAVARDTASWNVAHAAKEALKTLLTRPRTANSSVTSDDQERSI